MHAVNVPVEVNTWASLQPILSKALFVGIFAVLLAVIFNKHEREKSQKALGGCLWVFMSFGIWGVALIIYSIIAGMESDRPDLLAHNPRVSTALYVIALCAGNLFVWPACLFIAFSKPDTSSGGYSNPMAGKRRVYDSEGNLIFYVDRD